MADDLKLSVVIQALLDAKGFEEAKVRLQGVASQAATAAPAIAKTGEAAKRMGESMGGTRGPIADVTRVLLMNVGVTGAAGEAAKAAGTAMYFLEGAASASAVAISGGVAAIAFLLPLLVKWFSATEEQKKEQFNLKKQIEDTLPIIERYAAQAKVITESARLQLTFNRNKTLREEAEETHRLAEELAFLAEQHKVVAAAGLADQPSIDLLGEKRGRLMDLREAMAAGITVAELYERRTRAEAEAHDAAADAAKRHAAFIDDLAAIELRQVQEQLDAAAQVMAFNEAAQAEQERIAREGIEKPSTAAQRRRKLEEEAELTLAQIRNNEDLAESRARLAEAERFQTAQGLANIAASAGALSALFNKNKGLAIAEAIVNAAAGSVAAGRDTHGPVWVRIAAIAAFWTTALAQIQAIRSAEPVGFDDPFADLTARRLGRRSAEDFAKHFGGEFVGRLPGLMMQQAGHTYHTTTINRGTTINGGLTLPGFMGAGRTEMLKHLNRELIKIARLERRTTVGR